MDTERKLNAWVVQMRTSQRISFAGRQYDPRTRQGRKELDEAVLWKLRQRHKPLGVRDLVIKHTEYWRSRRYDKNMERLQACVERLVAAGKLLPPAEDGHLTPCWHHTETTT